MNRAERKSVRPNLQNVTVRECSLGPASEPLAVNRGAVATATIADDRLPALQEQLRVLAGYFAIVKDQRVCAVSPYSEWTDAKLNGDGLLPIYP